MPKIPSEFIDDLLARTDIVDLVSSYVKLTRRSGSSIKGLCPFHSEKTPSFSVNTDRQMYHCFGCGKGGSAVTFIMEIENLPFTDAVEVLAKRAGMTVPSSGETSSASARRSRLLDLNKDAAKLYHDTLYKSAGASALDYMRKRGITDATAKKFGLGAAPDSWNFLSDTLRKRGYTADELSSAGLIKHGQNGGIYDTFRDRLMFPVIDVRGNVVGFSGRALGDGTPKYLNSPATPVFVKGRVLFGLNIAKKTKAGMLILVEGNIDVVSLHQSGLDCAVASLGTALTPEQAQLMRQYTQTVVLAYDGDEAGVKAAQSAINTLDTAGVTARILRMSGAKDPDEYVAKYGADAFRLLLDRSENHIEYRLRDLLTKSDTETDDGRVKYLKEAVTLLRDVRGAAEREVYGRAVALTANISYETLVSEINAAIKTRNKRAAAQEKQELLRVKQDIQPSARTLRYKNEASAVAEQGVIQSLLYDPELFRTVRGMELTPEEFTSPLLGRTYERLLELDAEGVKPREALLVAEMEPDEAAEITRVVSAVSDGRFAPSDGKRAVTDYIDKIRAERARSSEISYDALLAAQRNKQRKVLG